MGTRIKVIVEHDIADYRDCAIVIDLLAPTLPAVLAVADYWRSVDPDCAPESPATWTARPLNRALEYSMYVGPGSVFINVGSKVALIYTGARWRGFLSIEPLRRVHLAAIRSIARAFGSGRLVYFPSEGVADDLFPTTILRNLTASLNFKELMATLSRRLRTFHERLWQRPSIARRQCGSSRVYMLTETFDRAWSRTEAQTQAVQSTLSIE